MADTARFILSQIADVKRIVNTEVWLEGERRGKWVDWRDPVVRDRVVEIILNGAGDYLRRKHLLSRGLILLVDDEEGILEVVGWILTEQGYTVVSARDGVEGWETFKESSSWDLVILDRAMPGMGGEELGRKIKAKAPQMALMMLTGNTTAISDRGIFDEILAKPFRAVNLVTCVSRAIESRAQFTCATDGRQPKS